MPYDMIDLRYIFDKTNGYCYHCRKKLAWKNYGVVGVRGAWEVDHSNPRAKGGTDYIRNLIPSCISCNRSKGILSSRKYQDSIFLGTLLKHSERYPELFPKKKRRKKRQKQPFGLRIADANKILTVSGSFPAYGAYIGWVKPKSPAEKVGLQAGDIVVQINNQ